ncbi:MAG TPA: hypothetical protein VJH03_13625 [Blastocatellia bacterium]|nr:hypothetical protein [Blastocatellia bacterium]
MRAQSQGDVYSFVGLRASGWESRKKLGVGLLSGNQRTAVLKECTMASPRSKKKRRGHRRILEEFRDEIIKEGTLKDAVVLLEPRGKAKMSEVLAEFIEPYRDDSISDFEDLDQLIAVGVIAWNVALLPGRERKKMVDRFVNEVAVTDSRVLRRFIEDMIERKRTHFREHNRLIMDYKVTATPNGPHLSVFSSIS